MPETLRTVDIAMPTHNCARFLDGCIQSLITQEVSDWRLIARDDRSSDDTGRILAQWQSRLDDRMLILPDSGTRNLGVVGNYTAVLAAATTAHVMTADPDDVWLPGKITRTIEAMLEAEVAHGATTPIAICTDAQVIDADGQHVATSYWRRSRMSTHFSGDLTRVAMESLALGSTMMINRALLEIALPIPAGSPYQDWWLALVAVAFGRLIALPERTILYRRHGTNETTDPYSGTIKGAISRTLQSPGAPRRRLQKVLEQAATQSAAFVERYRGRLKAREIAGLEALASLPHQGPVERRLAVVRHRLWFNSPLKNAGLLALL